MLLEVLQCDADLALRLYPTGNCIHDCVCACAARRQFQTRNVSCGIRWLSIDGKEYRMDDTGAELAMEFCGGRIARQLPCTVELTPQ